MKEVLLIVLGAMSAGVVGILFGVSAGVVGILLGRKAILAYIIGVSVGMIIVALFPLWRGIWIR